MRGLIQEVRIDPNWKMYHNYDEKLAEAVENYQPFILKRRAMGILGKPTAKYIELDKVSHRINALFFADGVLKVNLTLLDTPFGRILETLLEQNIDVSVYAEMLVSANYGIELHKFELNQLWIGISNDVHF